VEYQERPAEAAEIFARADRFAAVEETAEGWEFEMTDGSEPREVMAALSRLGELPTRFERVQRSLHEIFVERVGAQAAAPRKLEVAHA
jgi:ABC-2 type transport system ATP-binding protein